MRHLQRLELGTPYPVQAEFVAQLLLAEPLNGEAPLICDATGIGAAIVDLFRLTGAHICPVVITSGTEVSRDGRGGYRVPKLELVSRLQALLHSGELKIAKALPEASALAHELQNFRVAYTTAGNIQFAARTGAHDDLITALALAVCFAARPMPYVGMFKIKGIY